MKSLRFVHLSDIHFGQEAKGGGVEFHYDVRDELEADCKRQKDALGSAHGLIVTGDIAYSGKSEEYEDAVKWLDKLCNIVGCPRDNVLVVPGNHDVDIDCVKGAPKMIHDQIRGCKPNELERILAAINSGAAETNPLYPKLAKYHNFAKIYNCEFEDIKKPKWVKYFPIGGTARLKFVGLCTVQVSDLDDRKGDLILGESQYILSREDDVEYVVLMHHPPDWLKDQARLEDYFNSRVRVLICGHEHKARITVSNHNGRFEQLLVDSGATNPPKSEEAYGYSYNWLEFSLESGTPCNMSIGVYPRRWSHDSTRFEEERGRMDLNEKKGAIFTVKCPDLKPEAAEPKSASNTTENLKVNCAPENSKEKCEVLVATGEDRRFKMLCYFFWRYVQPIDRISLLVALGIIKKPNALDSIPQDVEMSILKRVREMHKLHQLWTQIMLHVPEAERENNPFTEEE